MKLHCDLGDFSRDYHGVTADGNDDPAFTVFSRRGEARHFWSGEYPKLAYPA